MLPGKEKATLYRSNNLPARVTVRFPINASAPIVESISN